MKIYSLCLFFVFFLFSCGTELQNLSEEIDFAKKTITVSEALSNFKQNSSSFKANNANSNLPPSRKLTFPFKRFSGTTPNCIFRNTSEHSFGLNTSIVGTHGFVLFI